MQRDQQQTLVDQEQQLNKQKRKNRLASKRVDSENEKLLALEAKDQQKERAQHARYQRKMQHLLQQKQRAGQKQAQQRQKEYQRVSREIASHNQQQKELLEELIRLRAEEVQAVRDDNARVLDLQAEQRAQAQREYDKEQQETARQHEAIRRERNNFV